MPTIPRAIEILAPSFGLQAVALHARSGPEIEQVIREFASQADSGLIVSPTSTNAAHRKLIFSVTSETRLPAIYPFSYYARQGGLMLYGFDAADLFEVQPPPTSPASSRASGRDSFPSRLRPSSSSSST